MEFLEILDGTSEEIITLIYLFIGPTTYCDRTQNPQDAWNC